MSICILGTKEIFYYKTSYMELHELCKDDSPLCIEKFLKFYQARPSGEFKEGAMKEHNVLMMATSNSNLHLVSYIVKNANPAIINMRDNHGYTALHHAVHSTQPAEKIIACAQILIEAGADINAREVLDESDLQGENILGRCARILGVEMHPFPKEQETLKRVLDLFISYGARKGYTSTQYSYTNKDKNVGWFGSSDEPNTDWCSYKHKYVKILQESQNRVFARKWTKTRLLYVGNHDKGSPLSHLPDDILNLLFQEISKESQDI